MPDLAAHLADLVAKLLTDLRTRFHLTLQIQQLPNLGQREAESLRLLDEFQVFDVAIGKQAETPVGSNRTMEKHLLLVEAYGVRRKASCLGHLTDLEPASHAIASLTSRIHPGVNSRVKRPFRDFGS